MTRPRLKQTYALGIISFLSGFALMAYELVAARLLAPTIGSSIYVWTSVIGIIIASLSLGYWLGGKLADARQKQIDVVILGLGSALFVVITMLTFTPALDWISSSIEDVRLQGVIASFILFAPASFLLGMKSPYLAKLNIKNLDTAGESVANLSALNSIGGILGTFITGFFFFGYLGSKETLVIVVVILLASSWLLVPRQRFLQRVMASIILLLISLLPTPVTANSVARIDTPSAHYDVSKFQYEGRTINGLTTGPGGIQSAVYTEGANDLVFWYTQYAGGVIEHYAPERILILGGGAFTLPSYLAQALPNSTIDAVEIDPELENISKEYFNYTKKENLNLIFSDARSFVNTTEEKYDAIFVDVYGDAYVPFQVLTAEYGARINALLKPGGMVVINAIVGVSEQCRELLGAIDSVYRPYFPYARWQTETGTPLSRGNYILIYTKYDEQIDTMKKLPVQSAGKQYTDNFMPAERLNYQCKQ